MHDVDGDALVLQDGKLLADEQATRVSLDLRDEAGEFLIARLLQPAQHTRAEEDLAGPHAILTAKGRERAEQRGSGSDPHSCQRERDER